MKLKHTLAGLAVAACACLTALPTQAGETTVGGKMYGDFSYKSVKDADGNKIDGTGTGYDGKRFYVTVDHVIDEIWSLNFTTDIGDQNGAYDVYAKKAYVQAKLRNAPVTVRAGSADLPWIPAVEGLYGFRYVENVIVDRLKFGTSADWGMHVMGKAAAGRIDYQASVVNGGGYKHPARSKTVDFAGRIGATPVDGLNVAVGGYVGKLGQEMETTAFSQNASRADVVAAYAKSGVKVGGEFFQARQWKLVTTDQKDKAQGFSGWASVEVAPAWTLFGRYDSARLSKDLDPDYEDRYFNVGIQYAAAKGLVVSPVFKYEKKQKSTTAANNNKVTEFGIFAQAKF